MKAIVTALVGIAIVLGAPTNVGAEIIPFETMLRGVESIPAQCASKSQSVWVATFGRGFCVRYYLSTAGGTGDRPVVVLQGDKLGPLDPKTGEFQNATRADDVDTDKLAQFVERVSKRTKTTALYLARIGVDGSSGHHRVRKTILELAVMNAALEAIKARHSFVGFHLVGQSGGATLVGGLLGRRRDLACAVPGAGKLAHLRTKKQMGDPEKTYFDPSEHLPEIIRSRARILVITDPADKKVPEKNQTTFVNQVREAGGKIEQYFVHATDENHHGLLTYAIYAAAKCMEGANPEDIGQGLAKLVEKRVAAASQNANAAVNNHEPPASAASYAISGPTNPRTQVEVRRTSLAVSSQQPAPPVVTDRAAAPYHSGSYRPRHSRVQAQPLVQSAPTIPYPYAHERSQVGRFPGPAQTREQQSIPSPYRSNRPIS